MLENIPLPNLPGNVDNLQTSVAEKVSYWNFSQRVDLNISDNLKVFARAGRLQGRSLPGQPARDRRRVLPAVGQQPRRAQHRRRRRVAPVREDDAQRPRQLLQHDRRVLQPGAAARVGRPRLVLAERLVLVALQQRLRLLSGARRHLGHRHERQQPARAAGPRVVPASRRLDAVGPHEPLPGRAQPEVGRRDARLLRRGGPLRADQPGLQLDADRQQLRQSRRSPPPATSGRPSCSARWTTTRRRGWCRCRRPTCAATRPTSRTTGRSASG